jgi:protein-disulfide isomerase
MARETTKPSSRRERRAQARYDRPATPRHRSGRQPVRPAWQSPVVLVSVAAVLIGIAVIAFARPATPGGGADLITPPTSYAVGLANGDVLGAATAPVVIQLYSDFQCPACKVFVTTQLPSLVKDFVVPGTVRIEAHDIDILGRGTPNESLELAAGAACAAEQGRYWQFHDLVFWNQGRENQGDHDAAFIARVADAAEVDRAAWDACFARNDVRPPIVSGSAAAVGAGINSTPTLVVNGQPVIGVPKYDQLAAMIRQLASPAPTGSAPVPTAVPS